MDILRHQISTSTSATMVVMEIQLIEVPEFPILRGVEAIGALYDFIDAFEEQRGKELTDKQTTALIKLAEGLISCIEAETYIVAHNKGIKDGRFVTQLKKTITKYIPESVSQALRFA